MGSVRPADVGGRRGWQWDGRVEEAGDKKGEREVVGVHIASCVTVVVVVVEEIQAWSG